MNSQLRAIIEKDKAFNSGDMAAEVFGFDRHTHYDLLVVAPGWKPTKTVAVANASVRMLAEHSYTSGYEVRIGDSLIAWAQTGAGACNLIDHLTLCVELDFDKLVFVGAVGGLTADIAVGDVCTPVSCIEGTMAPAYLLEDPRAFRPFGKVTPKDPGFIADVVKLAVDMGIQVKECSVFCTDSISCEYYHLDFIKSFGTDLIEMETSAFYRLAAMLEKPAIALLAVSDNSANGEPLLGMPEVQQERYNQSRKLLIPRLLEAIAKM